MANLLFFYYNTKKTNNCLRFLIIANKNTVDKILAKTT